MSSAVRASYVRKRECFESPSGKERRKRRAVHLLLFSLLMVSWEGERGRALLHDRAHRLVFSSVSQSTSESSGCRGLSLVPLVVMYYYCAPKLALFGR